MAQPSLDDRINVRYEHAPLADLQIVLNDLSGLADALELTPDEQLSVSASAHKYGFYLSKPIQREKIHTSKHSIKRNRQAIIDAILDRGEHPHSNELRSIIATRLTAGKTHEPWQFQCHPVLLTLLAISKVTPADFIARMKGHVGEFRTSANPNVGYNNGKRRNFSKLVYDIIYNSTGGEIEIKEIKIPRNLILRTIKQTAGLALQFTVRQTFPETLIDQLIGGTVKGLVDDPQFANLLAGEKIAKIINNISGATIVFEPRRAVSMDNGSQIVNQEYDRIAAKLQRWAEQRPATT